MSWWENGEKKQFEEQIQILSITKEIWELNIVKYKFSNELTTVWKINEYKI